MVLLLITIDLKDDYLGGDLFKLDGILSSLDAQEGYRAHSVNRDLRNQAQLLLIAEWKSEAAVERYMQTDEFKLLIQTIKMVGKKYAVSFVNVLSSGGLELPKERIVSSLEEVPGE